MWQKVKNLYHLGQAVLANIIYGFPSKKLKVIGVTGTDGKTTTASLIYQILKESGKKTALISTVGAYIGDKVYDVGFHVTNPAAFPLQKFIKQITNAGSEYLVLEVTSHGLDQNRVWGIEFDVGVLTNITHEHLDYHGSWEEYVRTKMELLGRSRIRIVNLDDDSYKFLISNYSNLSKNKTITYSLIKNDADYNPKKFPFKTNLIGDFNKSNCLAAIAAAKSFGISDENIRKALSTFKTPIGRLETVHNKDFKVVVDFAHTPNAFAQLLPEIKIITSGKLIHVFGCAGERDASKRPLMGKESSKFADVIILTAEDPRSEKAEKINNDIHKGVSNEFTYINSDESRKNIKLLYKINDRKKAIEFAVSIAQKGDTVLLTGKAHEKSMNHGQGEESWDEFEVVKEALNKKPLNSK